MRGALEQSGAAEAGQAGVLQSPGGATDLCPRLSLVATPFHSLIRLARWLDWAALR